MFKIFLCNNWGSYSVGNRVKCLMCGRFCVIVIFRQKAYICQSMVENPKNMETTTIQAASDQAVSSQVVSDYELERGKPMPSKNHGIIQGNLYFLLRTSYSKLYTLIPEVKVAGTLKDVVPDLAIYDRSVKFTPREDEIKMTEAPLCAIEILSPTQSLSELVAKSKQFFELGTKSYWLVIPDLLTIHILEASGKHTVFVEQQTLRDEGLNIQIELKEIFN